MTLLALLGHDLLQHSRIWRVSKMVTLFTSSAGEYQRLR